MDTRRLRAVFKEINDKKKKKLLANEYLAWLTTSKAALLHHALNELCLLSSV